MANLKSRLALLEERQRAKVDNWNLHLVEMDGCLTGEVRLSNGQSSIIRQLEGLAVEGKTTQELIKIMSNDQLAAIIEFYDTLK